MVRNIIIYKLYLNIAKYIIQIMAQNAVTEFNPSGDVSSAVILPRPKYWSFA